MALQFRAKCPSGSFLTGGVVESIKVNNFNFVNNLISINCGKNDRTPELKISVPPQSNNKQLPEGATLITTELPECKNGFKVLKSLFNNTDGIPEVEGIEFTCNGNSLPDPGIGYNQFLPIQQDIQTKTLTCPDGKVMTSINGIYRISRPDIGLGLWIENFLDDQDCIDFPTKTSNNEELKIQESNTSIKSNAEALKLQESNDNTFYTLAILIILISIILVFSY